jgi:hypothetical protein
VHTFNGELVRQLNDLMQTLDAMRAVMTEEPHGQPASCPGSSFNNRKFLQTAAPTYAGT